MPQAAKVGRGIGMSSDGTSSVGSKELFKKLDREVGARIRRRRLELGMSQREVAERTGFCSYQQLQKYELGENRITISSLVVIARVLGTSIETLFRLDEAGRSDKGQREPPWRLWPPAPDTQGTRYSQSGALRRSDGFRPNIREITGSFANTCRQIAIVTCPAIRTSTP